MFFSLQPIWAEGERSIEFCSFSGSSKSKSPPPSFPQRVSVKALKNSNSRTLTTLPTYSDSEIDSSLDDDMINCSSSESEAELEVIVANKKIVINFVRI